MSEPVESTSQIEYRCGSGNLPEDYQRDIVFYIFIVLYFYCFMLLYFYILSYKKEGWKSIQPSFLFIEFCISADNRFAYPQYG